MRVGLVNGSVFACPPRGYGSEIATWYLARELVCMGHEVHLFAPGGSKCPDGGYLHVIPGSYGGTSRVCDGAVMSYYRDVVDSCDVVHDLSATCQAVEEMALEGMQNWLVTRNGIQFATPRFGSRNNVVLSNAARECALTGTSAWKGVKGYEELDRQFYGRLNDARVVYYGTDVEFYKPGDEVDDYVLYVGRPHSSKGVDLILEAARRMPQQRFVLAWRAAMQDHGEFEKGYLADISRLTNVEFVELPEAIGHHEAKRDLYQRARVFVSPCRYTEAFGLTAIEALSCGTPIVLGINGAGPEIVTLETGSTVDANSDDAVDQVVTALGLEFNRSSCREDALMRWTAARMAHDYERLYEEVAGGGSW